MAPSRQETYERISGMSNNSEHEANNDPLRIGVGSVVRRVPLVGCHSRLLTPV